MRKALNVSVFGHSQLALRAAWPIPVNWGIVCDPGSNGSCGGAQFAAPMPNVFKLLLVFCLRANA